MNVGDGSSSSHDLRTTVQDGADNESQQQRQAQHVASTSTIANLTRSTTSDMAQHDPVRAHDQESSTSLRDPSHVNLKEDNARRTEHDETLTTTLNATNQCANAKPALPDVQLRAASSSPYLPSVSSSLRSTSEIRSDKVADSSGRLTELKRFTLWETRTNFYLVAYNTSQTLFRILKVDRLPGAKSDYHQNQRQQQQQQHDAVTPMPPPADTRAAASSASHSKAEGGDNVGTASAVETPAPSMQWSLNVTADNVVYTRGQISELLDMISEGNKSTGGLKEVGRFFGIVGFIRFTSTYYMVLISRRSVVGLLGGHYLYHCDETKIIPVCPPSVLASVGGRTKAIDQEEAHLLHTFKQVDLGKNFYFSYTYDLTKTLQDNLTRPADVRKGEADTVQPLTGDSVTAWGYNEKFIWNHHLLLPAFSASEHSAEADSASQWVLPLVYGFVDQAKLRVLNCTIHVTLIARRSRHFAGARFLKRGTDERGHVANDVETEQIISDALTTPFYSPTRFGRRGSSGRQDRASRGPNPRYTSYVMHRGSIPIFWTQDSTNMSPRPPIEISVVDPYYSSAALHFDDMLRRYGHPIIILNLIKSKEKQQREVKLLHAFGECIRYLNQFLPTDKRLRYIAWDMSRASKSRDQDVIGVLEDIAEETISATKFFHSGPEPTKFAYKRHEMPSDGDNTHGQIRNTILLQSGVARVNCVDCLDRTNAAQFVIGKAAFGHQLYALGLLDHPSLPFDSDAVDMLTEMYHDLGDTIALQYGGSHLVNTMETYRKINQWTSHSRDMLEGLKRYYSNSFVDAEKQAAINLFLGVDNDAPDFRPVQSHARRHYQQWYTPMHLEARGTVVERQARLEQVVADASSFWAEYYRPSLFTDLMRHHAFKMTAIHQQQSSVAPSPAVFQQPSAPIATARRLSNSSSSRDSVLSNSPTKFSLQYASSETTPSPFISRVPLPASSPSMAGSQQNSAHSQQRAIIGGVRRWMSLNRGEHDDATMSSTATERKVSAKRLASDGAIFETSVGDSPLVTQDAANPAGMATILSAASAWPTWDEITGVSVAATTTGALLTSLLSPSVSAEEIKEYSSWLDQFRDISFDGGMADILPEPAALLPASHVNQAAAANALVYGSHFLPHIPQYQQAPVSSSTAGVLPSLSAAMESATLAPAALVAPQQLHLIGVRRPATQKQRQQIAEADARLYDREAALAAGDYQFLSISMNADGNGVSGVCGADDRNDAAIEPALSHYPLATNTLHAPPSDAKLRAYTHWLAGHSQSLTIVAP